MEVDLFVLSKPQIHSKEEGRVYASHIPAEQWWAGKQTPAGEMICPPHIMPLIGKVVV